MMLTVMISAISDVRGGYTVNELINTKLTVDGLYQEFKQTVSKNDSIHFGHQSPIYTYWKRNWNVPYSI